MGKIYEAIGLLLKYGEDNNLINKYDKIVVQNLILKSLNLLEFQDSLDLKKNDEILIHEILEYISFWAVEKKIIKNSMIDRELLEAEIMGHLTPAPSIIIEKFMSKYIESPEKAAKNYYNFSKKINYIKMDRINKNLHWNSPTEYGNMEITINLSKPEKDPKDILREKNTPSSSYPKCLLCYENVGYFGRINHPARQNLRVIPIKLTNEEWFLQYSPYVYYNEHAIIFCKEHRPMKIEKNTFKRLIEFIDFLPNYFIGSNADLPIVGGSILSHDHFQGGNHKFPMEKAKIESKIEFKNYPNIEAGILKWPMSVIRLRGKNKEDLIHLSDNILKIWRGYSDKECEILACSEKVSHNTITPIARKKIDSNSYEIDLVLRNNRTSEEHPMGIFHPHQEVHHIKKENIGLIEVMGLAVLPGRLKEEIIELSKIIKKESEIKDSEKKEILIKHEKWLKEIKEKYLEIKNLELEEIEQILKVEIGVRFSKVLEHAGVYKRTQEGKEGFARFTKSISEL